MADSNNAGGNSGAGGGGANNAEVQIQIPGPSKAEAPATQEKPGKPLRWWVMVAVDVFFLIAGQTSATLLGRYYYTQGGRSKWISAFVQTAGFPILFFALFFFPSKSPSSCTNTPMAKLAVIYIVLGLIIAADDTMYSSGLKYLPASTYSLICASQLAFNVIFSYVLNSQRVTPLIFNSVVLLTLSASLLGVSKESQGVTGVSGGKYLFGIVLTLGASCTYSLILSLMQLTFETIIKKHTFSAVLNMQIYTALVATFASTIGLFASGEWKTLKGEMDAFKSGQFSYLMTLVWAAVSWQIASIGVLGLIFEVSALFSNVISTVSLPVIPFFAVMAFNDGMSGVKIVAMLIALWGFASYLFQHHLDGKKAKKAAADGERDQEDGRHVVAESDNGTPSRTDATTAAAVSTKRLRWWAVVLANIVFLLGGQSVATLLGRIYYDQGGNSLWLATLVQSCGAPLVVPLLLYFRRRRPNSTPPSSPRPPLLKIAAIYAGLGVLLAGDNLMYSYALLYLPLSTYSLICATQLAFNAVFSYFLNKERLTALVFNSVVLLTFSAALVGVGHGSDATNSSVPEGKFAAGFALTLAASALFALILSLMQLTFDAVLRRDDAAAVLELQLWSNAAAACVSVAGLFVSGEWGSLAAEMGGYRKGKVAYGMTLAWTAASWQLCTMGMVGLVATVSSLFTNVISTVGMPLSPVVAVIFLGDRMDGVKVLAMLIGIWGFLSYIYQHYLDDAKICNMAHAQEVQLQIRGIPEQADSGHGENGSEPKAAAAAAAARGSARGGVRWWLTVSADMLMVLCGQTVATLLGRFYYNSGGNSKWMATLTQSAASPLLAILLLFTPPPTADEPKPAPSRIIAPIYIGLGIIVGFDNLMYSYALQYLPVSTFSLVAATQLGFNAVTSRLINSQRFTALIANSVVVLTFSASLLGIGSSSDETSSSVPRGKYAAGFVLTLAASAVFALILSLFELTFDRLVRARTLRCILRAQVCTGVVASVVSVAGLMASGDWRTIPGEMEGFRNGRARYVATLVGTAVSWQVMAVGSLRLIVRVSSLFANVTGTLSLPLVPVFAVAMFGDRMTGIKAVSMLMAVWGFLSYAYQQYIDGRRAAAGAGKCRVCFARDGSETDPPA
uniref:Uncharacterized protein n=1 Tax=Leersia perrieri TaxID=77586 RepID=A0A0D9W8R0_9ORYZ